MKIAILGYDSQGRSAYEYWNKPENELTICDKNQAIEIPDSAPSQLGEDYLSNLNRFDMLIRTPGLHPGDIIVANPESPNILDKVTTNTNEFFRVCPTKNIIGVTGTKGKGTTTTLIAKMLAADAKRVHVGGNIGIPPLDLLKDDVKPYDWVVLELANFQLIDLKYSPHIAVCLMTVPEHMDWHEDFEEYVAAKQQLFINQTEDDVAIYYPHNENSESIACASTGKIIPYMQTPGATVENDQVVIDGKVVSSVHDIALIGKHNWQNVCAAITAVWQVTQNIDAMHSVINSFTGIEHRLELVRELDGVKYYDDSFGTTPETAIVAIEAIEQPKVIILGGSDKGSNYDELGQTVAKHNVKNTILIGEMAENINKSLKNAGYTQTISGGQTMTEIVQQAHELAKPGDVVILSTACASFDMFKNYKDRGEQFKQAVLALASTAQ